MKRNIIKLIAFETILSLVFNYIIIFEEGFMIEKNISPILLVGLIFQFVVYFTGTLLLIQKQELFRKVYFNINLMGISVFVCCLFINNCLYSSEHQSLYYIASLVFVSIAIYSAVKLAYFLKSMTL